VTPPSRPGCSISKHNSKKDFLLSGATLNVPHKALSEARLKPSTHSLHGRLKIKGVMRHPAFITLREDKTAGEYNPEDNAEDGQAITIEGQELLVQGTKQNLALEVDAHLLQLTNLKKIYWPKEKISKGDMLNYYSTIAPYMVPYMQDRPQSLNRFPNGINGESFYQKNMKGKVDGWLTTFERLSEGSSEAKDFLVCTGTASLLYMANLGCIEMNPWHSRISSPLHPDWCIMDLDPGRISFEKVIETAQVIHQLLESIGVPSFPKTSGSTGIHIYIPLGAKYSYEQSRQLAEIIAILIHSELPAFTSIERNPLKRKDKIYLDYLQNRSIQTICAPYSLRPKPGATVSAPLHWSEVEKGLQIKQFTIKNMNDRVKREGDLFAGVLGEGINLNEVLKTMSGFI
jgi:bifunctional non-homologous end joining protein LigD